MMYMFSSKKNMVETHVFHVSRDTVIPCLGEKKAALGHAKVHELQQRKSERGNATWSGVLCDAKNRSFG